MGWEIIEKGTHGAAQKNVAPLVCSITRAGKPTTPPRLVLLFRPAVRECAPWLTMGARILVQRGTAQDRGMLRLSPHEEGRHTLTQRGAQQKGTALALMLLGLKSCPASVVAQQVPCEFDYNDTDKPWLVATVPPALRAVLWEPLAINGGGIGPIMDAERARGIRK